MRITDLRKMRRFLPRSDFVKIKARLGKNVGSNKSKLLNSQISQIAILEQKNAALRKEISAVNSEIELVREVKEMAVLPQFNSRY